MKKFSYALVTFCVVLASGCSPLSDVSGAYSGMYEDYSKATNFNISQGVNNPERLKEPAEIGPGNSQAVVGAVERYQKGNVRDVDNDMGSASSGIGK